MTVTEPPTPVERYAFLGVRPCDLRAVDAQRRVLAGGRFPDTGYENRCRDTFVVAVGGRIFFAEPLTPRRIVSTGMIVIGVALVGWG